MFPTCVFILGSGSVAHPHHQDNHQDYCSLNAKNAIDDCVKHDDLIQRAYQMPQSRIRTLFLVLNNMCVA